MNTSILLTLYGEHSQRLTSARPNIGYRQFITTHKETNNEGIF